MTRVRAAFVLAVLTIVTLVAIPLQWLALKANWPLKRRLPLLWHKLACALVGIRVRENGAPARERPLLIAANHVSWIDITVLGSRMPLSFIAKSEVAGWPVFGLFAKLQRSVFVDRQRRSATGKVAEEIGTRLSDGDAMVLFAEGTSNDGNCVLPFRSALIGAARHAMGDDEAKVWIQPLSIAYTKLHGLPMGRQFRPHVAWYGDMEMTHHFLSVVGEGAIDVELTWGEPVQVANGDDRKALARKLEGEVRRMAAAALNGKPERGASLRTGDGALFSKGEKTANADAA
ncbi:1-acyl-sn-glycerol-3-phosphate acyltransferase [Rhizobiales bacterium]|uniref:lysophospholipid acyltransferase family protein n=1 Tax=Hongsoonwoonella zoysiae TaxID=2821844 RepID=UPI0015608B8E|nr:lysophospholipid acyltransferase family protein [Hongsoonwoonella zoysiae]NRG16528.1 1-acyl-sn-glycerol-3-phosphate acyltransferase [Hongsoonwoonella zoysiae]